MKLIEKYLLKMNKEIPVETKPIERKKPVSRNQAVKIYSKILEAYLWVIPNEELMRQLISEGVTEPIYTYDDIIELKKIKHLPEKNRKEKLKVIHKVKQAFPESTIKEYKGHSF